MITNFSDRPTKERAVKDVYKLLVYSYMGIAGGFLYSMLELLTKENTTWHTGIQNGNLKCVIISKETHIGSKIIACGCDGTREGKQELMRYLISCIEDKEKRYWCEASGVIEHWLQKHGVEAHPNEWAKEILGKDIENYSDDGIHYIRRINGVMKEKAIYGNLCDNRNNYNS